MRILIISAWYHPFIHPRAHRWTHVAEHWAAQGHEVHVVCSRRRDCPSEAVQGGVSVHRVGFDSLKEVVYFALRTQTGRGRVGAAVRPPGLGTRLLAWLYRVFWKNLYFPDDACLWYFPARRRVLTLLEKQSFDAVVSVSLPFTGHLIGLAAKRRFTGIPWLADIGDPFTIQAKPLNNARLYGRISRNLERKVLRCADAAVVTHAGAVRAYRAAFGDVTDRLAVVPPLWSESAIVPVEALPGEGGILIGYFGALYAPVRTPDAFLDLLEKTRRLRSDSAARLSVQVYGEIFPEFFKKLHEAPGVHLHGLRSREEAWSAMLRMDVLLHIGNSTAYQLPSKVVDYLASGKPVLHLSYVDDDPFLDFWGDVPGLLCLRVRQGRVVDNDLPRWLDFLEHVPLASTMPARMARVQGCRVDAVAGRYWELLSRRR